MKVYIRFGDIPKDFQSKVHKGDAIIRNEGGVSVWNCIQAGEDEYYPILPDNPNPHAISDYFRMLFSDKPVYLVTGTEMFLTGADGEPLLMSDITIIKKLDYSCMRGVKNDVSDIIDEIDIVNTIEVRPKGEWILIDDTEKFIAKCSVCGRTEDSRMVKFYPFCHCGARMKGSDNE